MHTRTKVFTAGTLVAGALIGLASVPPARAAFEAVMSCAQSSACLEWDNTKSGDAIKGVSSKGNALHGQTKFNSTGKTAGKAGVFGEDLSSSGTLNSGVNGVSTNGAGVLGRSTSYNAVEGFSTNSTGVYGETASSSGLGVAGRNTSSTYNSGAGVYADGGPANDGIRAFSTLKSGVYAFSQNGTALYANNGSSDSASELVLQDSGSMLNDAIEVRGQSGDIFTLRNDGQMDHSGPTNLGGPTNLTGDTRILGGTGGLFASSDSSNAAVFQNSPGNQGVALGVRSGGAGDSFAAFQIVDVNDLEVMYVSAAGNVFIDGLLYSRGSCHNGCLQGGKQVRSVGEYAPVEAEPTIEDNGEAALVNGRADVALDPEFANVIDASSSYIVTITPEGDSRGLFVASRNASGFTVRESQGGRSSIGFAYRIVAKRYGVKAARLPMTTVKHSNLAVRGDLHRH